MSSTIKAEAFNERLKLDESRYLLDVRTEDEYRAHRLKDACVHIPVDQLSSEALEGLMPDKTRPVFVVCNSGRRAARAADFLEAFGYGKVFAVEGGLRACGACGVMARYHALLFFLTGILMLALGYTFGAYVHPVFYVLGGITGAGLMIRGLTGRCMVVTLLGKVFHRNAASVSTEAPSCCSLKTPSCLPKG
jgi:rhodanese-related sulfurtransferase